jgi:DNA-directed RNA polymerase specialized sigma24 family protein
MSQLTHESWWKAALDTLLWLLDPEQGKAEKAYLDLFNRLVVFFRHRGRNDAEDLAEETLTGVARVVYLRLTGLQKHDLSRMDIVHQVPRTISPQTYASEHDRIPFTAFGVARNVLFEKFRDRAIRQRANLVEDAEIHATTEAVEKRHQLLARALAELPIKDRRLIEEYYYVGDESRRRSRNDLARSLGLTASALRIKASRIRQNIKAKMTAAEAPAQAQFTAYYPRSTNPRTWNTILAYMHVADALQLVESDSRRRLSEAGGRIGRRTTIKRVAIARGAKILVVPHSERFEFNPPQVTFAWHEDFHCAEFRCRALPETSEAGPLHAGVKIAFYVAPILVAEISLTIGVDKALEQSPRTASVTARPYQRVFVSYSHNDSDIANQLEKAYNALGIEYLRDVRMLRSGESWAPALLHRIEESEIFQLLWSKAAKRSVNVQQEWQHALSLHRTFFIRPVYWDRPIPPPPRELADIHFAYLELRGKHL